MQPLFKLSLVEAARKIASGEITSAELTRSCLARIAQMDQVAAFAWLDDDRLPYHIRYSHNMACGESRSIGGLTSN